MCYVHTISVVSKAVGGHSLAQALQRLWKWHKVVQRWHLVSWQPLYTGSGPPAVTQRGPSPRWSWWGWNFHLLKKGYKKWSCFVNQVEAFTHSTYRNWVLWMHQKWCRLWHWWNCCSHLIPQLVPILFPWQPAERHQEEGWEVKW